MGFFKQIEGEAAIVIVGGVYKQCDLYERDGYIYAKVAGGFVRLYADCTTTKANVRLDFMSWDGGPLCRDVHNKLCRPETPGSIALEAPKKQLLLGGPAE